MMEMGLRLRGSLLRDSEADDTMPMLSPCPTNSIWCWTYLLFNNFKPI
jgi:hypothetical protein